MALILADNNELLMNGTEQDLFTKTKVRENEKGWEKLILPFLPMCNSGLTIPPAIALLALMLRACPEVPLPLLLGLPRSAVLRELPPLSVVLPLPLQAVPADWAFFASSSPKQELQR